MKLFMYRAELREFLGATDTQITKFIDAGLLTPITLDSARRRPRISRPTRSWMMFSTTEAQLLRQAYNPTTPTPKNERTIHSE
jgi:hypothetical protein